MSRPDRKIVERIADEESRIAHVRLNDVLGTCRLTRVAKARRLAIRRIIEETGCSPHGLARVWGCGFDTVRRAVSDRPRASYDKTVAATPTYDASTIARLQSRHGAARTLDIINGRDEATNADLASWRRIWCGS